MFRENFEIELSQLHDDIIAMGNYVNNAIKDAVLAYSTHDVELGKTVMANDKVVNDMEKKIESKCLWLIAREQPVASDLRSITTALKIITDMERIGDHAVDIAELALHISEDSTFADFSKVIEMSDAAIAMVRGAVKAYVNTDLEYAKTAEKADDIVDNFFKEIKNSIRDTAINEESDMDGALNVFLIAKYLERIADHAVNICEWLLFSETGEHYKG